MILLIRTSPQLGNIDYSIISPSIPFIQPQRNTKIFIDDMKAKTSLMASPFIL